MSTLPEHIRKSFIEALAQVPQRVLLKYEDEMENKPENIMIKKWLPQRDILCTWLISVIKIYMYIYIVLIFYFV